MVNATVDNEAISIQLSDGESTTVPSGEVWKVTISGRAVAETAQDRSSTQTRTIRRYCKINSVIVASSEVKSRTETYTNATSTSTTFPFETVLKGGDTVTASNTGLQIGGFVVKK